jgi:hypothetical protein
MRHASVLVVVLIVSVFVVACNSLGATEQTTPAPALPEGLPAASPAPTVTPQADAANDSGTPDGAASSPGVIEPASQPAVPDCNAINLESLNAIIGGSFHFVMQDEIGNCHFESDNNYQIMLGGGRPTSADEAKNIFESSFGTLPNATWAAVDNFYLGIAPSNISVTAQGVTASGHSIVILAMIKDATANASALLSDLATEAARQLNDQF